MTNAVSLAQQASTGVSQGFKNRIINGAAIIFQRGTSTAVDSTYFVDRWYIAKVGSGTYTADASATVPAGFFRSLLATVNTPDSSIAANDEFSIRQHIEGYNLVDFNWGTANAQTATLSFWVRSSVAGTYAVAVRSQNSDVTYVTTYTISSANTYEYKSVTIPGPTSGTFGQTNDVGCTVIFGLGGGTDYQGTANTWNSGNKFFTSSSTQWISNSGATWNVTGVQFEKGSAATSFEYRAYNVEFDMCRRYYERLNLNATASTTVNQYIGSAGLAWTSGDVRAYFRYYPKRAQPSCSQSGQIRFSTGNFGQTLSTGFVFDQPGPDAVLMYNNTGVSGFTEGRALQVFGQSSGYIDFSAEL